MTRFTSFRRWSRLLGIGVLLGIASLGHARDRDAGTLPWKAGASLDADAALDDGRALRFATDFDPANNLYRTSFETSTCADGLVEDAEQCDDGNLEAADGCASDCRIEAAFVCSGTPSICVAPTLQEVEPNDTLATADASPVRITASRTVLGALSTSADRDIFRIDIAQPLKVARLETFAPSQGDCTGGVTTTLRLYDAWGSTIVVDNASGISGCAALVFGLGKGVHYLQVEETGTNAPVAAYALQARFPSDLGLESESSGTIATNDTAATAEVALMATRDGVIFGDHTVSVDADYYAITVPSGAGVRAEIIEGYRQFITCESKDMDSALTLYAANGTTQKVSDDDDGRGFCSMIDGTGTNPLDLNARNTSGSTEVWYLAVRASGVANPNATSFGYRLAVTIR
jgi:cysteine-rich repeat protein